MIFDLTKHYVPEVYSDSRDYRVFLHMAEILSTVIKYNADHFPDLYDPANCPDNLLPYLASMVGYEYDYGLSVDDNRIIIKYFPFLIRNRGSEIGLKLAMSLSLNIHTDINEYIILDDIQIEYDYENGVITIYYPKNAEIRKYLLEVVRPIGMTIKMIPVDQTETHEVLDVKVDTKIYNKISDNTVDHSQVEYSEVSDQENREFGLVLQCAIDPRTRWYYLEIINNSDSELEIIGQYIRVSIAPHKSRTDQYRYEWMRDSAYDTAVEVINQQSDPSLYSVDRWADADFEDFLVENEHDPTQYNKIEVLQ